MPFRFPRGLSMEAEPSTLSLTTFFPQTANRNAIRCPFAFAQLPKSCFAAFADVWLQTANYRANQSDLPIPTNLFWSISETLYPSRLISFPTNRSLCPKSPKRRVLKTHKIVRTEVIREQRSKTQRHRGTFGQRCDSGKKASIGRQGHRIAYASRTVAAV